MTASPWDFVGWESIWPLPHVLLAYHFYMYTRSWIHVLCYYYLTEVFWLLLFAASGSNRDSHFSEILAFGSFELRETGRLFGPPGNRTLAALPGRSTCAVDFNGVFLGGTLLTFAGIFLGAVHTYLFAPSTVDQRLFHPVSFWKDSARKSDAEFLEGKAFLDAHARPGDLAGVALTLGMWPWHLWFGYEPYDFSANGYFGRSVESSLEGTAIKADAKKYPLEPGRYVYRRWRFRKAFWVKWVQLFALGTPALFFYSVDSRSALRAGTVAFGLVTVSLLLWFKEYNQKVYVDGTVTGADDRSEETRFYEQTRELADNPYEELYSAWMATCVALIAFQAIPWLTSFYRALISVALVAGASVAAARGEEIVAWIKNQIKSAKSPN